jgi:hypothetical protein
VACGSRPEFQSSETTRLETCVASPRQRKGASASGPPSNGSNKGGRKSSGLPPSTGDRPIVRCGPMANRRSLHNDGVAGRNVDGQVGARDARARCCPSVRRTVRASMFAGVREHSDTRSRSDLSKGETALRAIRRRSRDLPHRSRSPGPREKQYLIILKSLADASV